jgi:hypothetical protein
MIKFCSKCGVPNPLEAVFCGTCGNRLENFGSSEETIEIIDEEVINSPTSGHSNPQPTYNYAQTNDKITPIIQKEGKNYAKQVLIFSIIIGLLFATMVSLILTSPKLRELLNKFEQELNVSDETLSTYGNQEYGYIRLPDDFEVEENEEGGYNLYSEKNLTHITLSKMDMGDSEFRDMVDLFAMFLSMNENSNFTKEYVSGKEYGATISYEQESSGYTYTIKIYLFDEEDVNYVSFVTEKTSSFNPDLYIASFRR